MGAGKVSKNKSNDGSKSYKQFTDTYKELQNSDNFDEYIQDVNNWFAENSNLSDWESQIRDEDADAANTITDYTDALYLPINNALFKTSDLSTVDSSTLNAINNLTNALDKFELKSGIVLDRSADTHIFGRKHMSIDEIKQVLDNSNGVLQSDGFLSLSTLKNGISVNSGGVVFHIAIPPSKGAGAFVNNFSYTGDESEFLLNRNALLKFDTSSIYTDERSNIHINAEWIGRAKKRTID